MFNIYVRNCFPSVFVLTTKQTYLAGFAIGPLLKSFDLDFSSSRWRSPGLELLRSSDGMVPLPKRLLFCVVLNEIVGAARLTLPSVTEEAHAAQDSLSKNSKFPIAPAHVSSELKILIFY
jgi:hypothetical protein